MLTLSLLPETLAICKLKKDAPVPTWVQASSFLSITRTADELSVVCQQECVPPEVHCNADWRCFKCEGPIDFSAVGVLASVVQPLAKAHMSVFVVCSFDTDYVMVQEGDVTKAAGVLSEAGHRIQEFVRPGS